MLPGESMQQPMAIRPPQFPSDPAFSNPGYPSADFTSYQYATGLTAGPETMYPSPYGTPPASAFYPPASMVMPTTNRIQLGPAEQSHYMNLRAMIDSDPAGNLGGAEAAAFLATSGLPRGILHEIWRIADHNNLGSLNAEDFCVACRLVAHAQNGLPVWEDAIGQEPPTLPSFNLAVQEPLPSETIPPLSEAAPPLGSQFDPTRAAFESAPSANSMPGPGHFTSTGAWEEDGGIDLMAPPSWLLTETEKKKYIRLFKNTDGNGDGFVEGQDAGHLLRKSGLPEGELSHIWTVSDADADGRLTANEFLVAMHLVTKRRQGMPLPGSLPPELQLVLQTPISLAEADQAGGAAPTQAYEGFPATADEPWKSVVEGPAPSQKDFGGTFASMLPPPSEQKTGSKKSRKPKKERKSETFFKEEDSSDEGGEPAVHFGDRVLEEAEKDKSREQFDLDWDLTAETPKAPKERRSERLPIEDLQDGDAASILDTVVESDRQLNRRLAREIDTYANEISRLAGVSDALKAELIREKSELKRQLDRKVDFESRVAELKLELEGIKDEKRKVDIERTSVARDVDHYQEEILFLQQQVDDVEKDIKILRETTHQLDRQHDEATKHSQQLDMARKNVLHSLKAERQLLHDEEKRIAELRNVLERLRREKDHNQSKQIVAQERMRQSAQDRSMLLAGLESERSRLSKLRGQRLVLAEEAAAYDREMAELQQKWMQGSPPLRGDRLESAHADRPDNTWSSAMTRTAHYPGRDAKGIPVNSSIPADFYHSAPTATPYTPDGKPTHWTSFGSSKRGGSSVRVPSSGGTSAVERDRRGIDRILSRDASALAGEKKAAFDNEQEEDYIGSRRTTRDGMRHTAASPPLKPSARTTPQRKKKRQPKGASESEKEQSDSGPPSWPSFAEGSEMTPAFGPAK